MVWGLKKASNYYNRLEAKRDFFKAANELISIGETPYVNENFYPENNSRRVGWKTIDKHTRKLKEKIKALKKGEKMNLNDLTDIEIGGIKKNDFPDFSDAHISNAVVKATGEDATEFTNRQFYDLWNGWAERKAEERKDEFYRDLENAFGNEDADWQGLAERADELGISLRDIRKARTDNVATTDLF